MFALFGRVWAKSLVHRVPCCAHSLWLVGVFLVHPPNTLPPIHVHTHCRDKVELTKARNSHSIYTNPQVLKPREMRQIVLNSKARVLYPISHDSILKHRKDLEK